MKRVIIIIGIVFTCSFFGCSDFLDNEAFFLHRKHYLKWVSELLDFPVDYDNPDIFKFIDN